MPIYDYACAACGPFSDFVPMDMFEADARCPDCGAAAPRALLSVPHLAGGQSQKMKAHALNEKNAHAPVTSRKTGRHPAGCGCCSSKPAAVKAAGSRPWMISH
jgi:putative FmdB family regulatory protein